MRTAHYDHIILSAAGRLSEKTGFSHAIENLDLSISGPEGDVAAVRKILCCSAGRSLLHDLAAEVRSPMIPS